MKDPGKTDLAHLEIRRATPSDSHRLAALMNIAGEGLPAYLWSRSAEPQQDAMDYGALRVARPTGAFSYTNAHVAVLSGEPAGMLLSYRLADPYDSGPLEELPDVVRPLVALESLAPGTWYVNAVAVDASCRGRGVGRQLMNLAERLALATGSQSVSLIVAEQNDGARMLYERIGYRARARRPIVSFPGCSHAGDWLLMVKSLKLAAHEVDLRSSTFSMPPLEP